MNNVKISEEEEEFTEEDFKKPTYFNREKYFLKMTLFGFFIGLFFGFVVLFLTDFTR